MAHLLDYLKDRVLLCDGAMGTEIQARALHVDRDFWGHENCSEILNECSHRECDRKDALKKEIAAAVLEGKSDDAILDAMGAKYGATILTVPSFRGFNMLLWIVPVGAAATAVIAMIWRRWSWRTSRQETQS